ncbi:hypothetical protein WJ91_17715 [Burkholderia ubonensis]|nr:hypothetical protein WJ91_17715 [Burkholderia ubonensis]
MVGAATADALTLIVGRSGAEGEVDVAGAAGSAAACAPLATHNVIRAGRLVRNGRKAPVRRDGRRTCMER